MPKFLLKASYTGEGTKGVMKEGGSARRSAVEQAIKGMGGKVDAFYFAFGDVDVYVIIDVPDMATAAAVSMATNASGTVNLSTVPLMTPEEVDAAAKKQVQYRAPGR